MQLRDRFHPLFVLRVDGMTVAAIGGFPAVVVDNAAVHLAVGGAAPETDSLGIVTDHEMDVLAAVT